MEHTFKITNLDRVIESGLVNKVKFRLETTHGIFSDFINYEDLTEEIVLGWITGSIPVASMKHYNSSSIALQESEYTAPTTELGTPW